MGWGRMLLLGNIGQQLDIRDAQKYQDSLKDCLNTAIHALNSNLSLDEEQGIQIDRLKKENAELKLYVSGLVHLLVRKNVISESEMTEMVSIIDGPDQKTNPRV